MGQDQAGGAGFGQGRGGPSAEEREAERKRRLEERKWSFSSDYSDPYESV